MKKLTPFIALAALLAVVGCGGDSPSASPVPTVVPESWAIPRLAVSSGQVFVGTPVQVDIDVTRSGSPAPDGTVVELLSSGPGTLFGFTRGNLTAEKGFIELRRDARVVTEGGSATVFFLAADNPDQEGDEPAGSYTIQARVNTAVRTASVSYLPVAAGDTLVLTGINPDRGPYTGGQTVTIFGVNIEAPVEVFFFLNGRPYAAQIVSVVTGYDGWIVVTTPAFTGEDSSIQQLADVRVTVGLGSDNEQVGRLLQAYTLLPASQTSGPVIFGVSPTSGRSSGGEIVNILGQGFGFPAANMTVQFIDDASFSRLAQIVAVAPDGSQIQVETPRFSTLPLEDDAPQDVRVSTPNGSGQLNDAFLVLADNPTPEIATLSPTSGPLEGGTLVTIFGSGFQAPMQVFFGDLTAIDVNVFNDTTPADQDRITCVTPNYSQQGDEPPVTVAVRVVNMNSGNDSELADGFTYGDNLYISGNSPQEANAGDLVIIYGAGFEDPLQVFFPGDTGQQMEVVSVSGTEIVIRIPDDFNDECEESEGEFRVVLLESNLETEGGAFTIRGNSPTILSVSPILIPEGDLGGPASALTITGRDFAPNLLVQVGAYVVPSGDVTVPSSSTIEVDELPAVAELGISFDTIPCTTGGGAPGERSTSTGIDVTVTNFPGGCTDTLGNAIVIEPSNSSCVALPAAMSVSPTALNFGSSAAPVQRVFTIQNTGGTSFDWTAIPPGGVFSVVPANGPLNFGQSVNVTVTFTPTGGGATNYAGSITFTTNPPGVPGSEATVTLSASEP